MPLSDEFTLIKKIQRRIGPPRGGVLVGLGDDTAVLKPTQKNLLTTVDCLVENIHFTLKFFEPEDVGHKALAVNLSDIAAMGGRPLYALVSLGIREGIEDKFILRFYDGLLALAKRHGVQVVGGNLTKSPQFFADITVLGEGERPRLRRGAKPGDLVGISGELGLAASGLQAMLRKSSQAKFAHLIQRQKRPLPRVSLGMELGKSKFVNGMIDLSDGFSSELWHVSRASGVVIEIDSEKLPLSEELARFCRRYKYVPDDFIWNGGEDYELLVSFDPRLEKSLQRKLSIVGRVVSKGAGVFKRVKRRRESVIPSGWNHFEK